MAKKIIDDRWLFIIVMMAVIITGLTVGITKISKDREVSGHPDVRDSIEQVKDSTEAEYREALQNAKIRLGLRKDIQHVWFIGDSIYFILEPDTIKVER